jgi:hypothetical protein
VRAHSALRNDAFAGNQSLGKHKAHDSVPDARNPYSYEINTEKYMTYLDNSYNLNELRRTDENPGWDKIRCFLKDADEKVFLFAIN